MPHYLSHTRNVTATERELASERAQSMIDRVARLHAEGDVFASERFRLLRLLTIALGSQSSHAGQLLADALGGDTNAETRLRNELTELILLT